MMGEILIFDGPKRRTVVKILRDCVKEVKGARIIVDSMYEDNLLENLLSASKFKENGYEAIVTIEDIKDNWRT